MRNRSKRPKRIIAATLTTLFLSHQTMLLSVVATEITGPVGKVGNVYTVDPTARVNDIGYRKYQDFNVSKGDVVNLNFKHHGTDISTFINLVQNQVKVDGIVNSVRDGNFYGGKAVFVSPNGMIVGASGVLNVGSLGIYAVDQGTFDKYVDEMAPGYTGPRSDISGLKNANKSGNITINGKVFAANDVDIKGAAVDIAKGAGVFAGINDSQMQLMTDLDTAGALFNQLVNADGIKTGTQFVSSNGSITIDGGGFNSDVTLIDGAGIKIAGNVKNFGSGNTTIENVMYGPNGIDIKNTANILNKDGELYIGNTNGNLDINGTVKNTGTTNIYNNGVIFGGVDTNTTSSLNIGGTVDTTGSAEIINNGYNGLNITGNVKNDNGNLFIQNGTSEDDLGRNPSTAALNISGKVNATKGNTEIHNYAAGGLKVSGTVNTEGLDMTNHQTGTDGLTINGTVTNKGNANILNEANKLEVSGNVTNSDGALNITNKGANGLVITKSGKVTATKGNTKIDNYGAGGLKVAGTVNTQGLDMTNHETGTDGLTINGTVTNKGNANILNEANKLEVSGNVTNNDGTLNITNKGANGFNITKTGTVTNNGSGNTTLKNTGKQGLNISGKVQNGTGDLNVNNTGAEGLNLNSEGRIDGDGNVNLTNTGKKGVNLKGQTTAKKNININSKDSNVTIGDNTDNNNYVNADGNVVVIVNNGSLLNYGVEKTLIKAGGDLRMDVTDGTIGLGVQQAACEGSGCTGVGPKADGSRDFTKSINANVRGKVNATTTNTKAATKPEDLVINYAAIDSDMNIDAMKADGRVILTVDDDFGANNDGPRYNMINASTDPSKANIEGTGISLISNGNIGSADNKVTFNQTGDPSVYSMDALANEGIYLKGLDDKYTELNVCNMIAREGNIDVEFAGNTTINNITAEGDINLVTRGKSLTINNLGVIDDPSVTPADYFGERPDGWLADGGYDLEDHMHDVLPNNVTVKALDINRTIRPDGELIDGGYYAYADSEVRINNAVLDNGTLEITADNIYANGVKVTFGQDGFTKVEDNSTNKVIGASETPIGNAVRPEDVTNIGHDEHDRNYYYHEGDGDNHDTNIDDDDNIVDRTPLEPDTPPIDPPDNPPVDPGDNPIPDDGGDDTISGEDGSSTYIQRKILDESIDSIDKRQYVRYRVADSQTPVAIEQTNGVNSLLDVSRGGISVTHNNELKVGDVIPVHIAYGDLDIKADVKVVSSTSNRAGAMFVNLDQATANQLLYLNMMLEESTNLATSR